MTMDAFAETRPDHAAVRPKRVCSHCGLELAPGQAQYCCPGCAAAHDVVASLGLGQFYGRRLGPVGGLRPADLPRIDFAAYATPAPGGEHALDLLVLGMTCGACVWLIEQVAAAEPDVMRARVSLAAHRLSLRWQGPASRATELAAVVAKLGFRVAPWTPACLSAAEDAEGKSLLRALGIAAFGAVNVMLLSLAVWAGGGMGDATRGLLHWIGAAIALPVIAVAGLPFFRSALAALRARRTNMDLAISLAVLATAAMSVSEAVRNGPYTWFDSATSLLALLLAGRVLDRNARRRAGGAVARLLALQRGSARVLLRDDGPPSLVPAEAVQPGARVLVGAGERLLLDGVVETDAGETAGAILDAGAITGENLPRHFLAGSALPAGAINVGPSFVMVVSRSLAEGSIADMARLMGQAEQARGRYVALADRAARFYVPAVHAAAAATFALWWLVLDATWQTALVHAVSVLIITCPCGLAIAVPAVQVVAVGALFRRGVLVASGTALERLASADLAVLDKTGTLTDGCPVLLPDPFRPASALCAAAGLAHASRHPLARALIRACPAVAALDGVIEVPGQGLYRDAERLGNAAFCRVDAPRAAGPELWYAAPDRRPIRFGFSEQVRPDAADAVRGLRQLGLEVEILSGDAAAAVGTAADAVGVTVWQDSVTPAGKVARIEALRRNGRRPLLVGDGINDAGALSLAHVSASPAGATDLAQAVADVVLQSDRLMSLVDAITMARRAMRLSRQNIALSLAYNVVAVPLAVMGLVTPLTAAIAMASSSLLVIGNAIRAGR